MGTLRKLAGQSAIYGLSSIVGRFLNYLLVPLHTNIFKHPGEYGVVTELYAYISFLMIIYTYGMETSFFHFSEKEKENKNKVFSTGMVALLFSTILLSGSIILFSGNIADVLDYQKHPEYITWMALIIGFDTLTALPFARLRQQAKAQKFAVLKVANIIINITFNMLFFIILPVWYKGEAGLLKSFAHLIYNPAVGVGYVFIANLLASAATLLMMIPEFRFNKEEFDKQLLQKIVLYSLPLLVAGLAGMVNETLDRIMLKFLVNDHASAMNQLGIYGACYKLSILMTLFIQAFRYAAEPFFFAQFKKEDARKVYALVMKYFVITCAIIFLAIMMYLDIIKYFIGKNYWPGLKVVPILLLANICLGIFFNLSMWYKLTGETRFGAYFAVFGAVITITFNYMLIPKMGYMGAAWTTLICYASMMLASYITGQKKYPVSYETKRILAYVGIAIILFLISKMIEQYFHPNTTIQLLINTIILFGYLFMLSKKERPPVALK
ncbi:MAG TPA: polysaccharide biosynthesis C-terminal domain-containing protein [Bacteroidia bacterium]|nr:polysaccharide biosynthesis C-terminal domain-containing protein [Bacteroidia bacterium]